MTPFPRPARALLILTAVFAGVIISLSVFSKPAVEKLLTHAGFAGATVESVSIGLSGTNLKNIKLGDSTIGEINAYATLADILHLRLGKVVITDANLRGLPLPARTERATQTNGPFNIYVRDIQFDSATLTLPTPAGEIALQLNGTVSDRGPDYQLKTGIAAAGDFATLDSTLTATIDKATRRIEAHLEIANASVAHDPAIDLRRANGWIEAALSPGDGFPDISAQITAGASRLYGVPLQGLTLTATPAQILLNGQVANQGGDIAADIRIDTAGAARDRITAAVTAQLRNLDALGLDKVKGQGGVSLNVAADKAKTAPWQDVAQWENLAGTAEITAKKLTLPGLVTDAQAAARMTLSLDPAAHALTLKMQEASYADHLFALTKASAGLTLNLGDTPTAQGRIDIGQIEQKSKPAYLVPVKVSLEFTPAKDAPGTTHLRGEITEKNGLLYARLQGQHDTARGAGSLSLDMPPLTLAEGVNKLTDLFPAAGAYAQDTYGTFGLAVDLRWQDGKPLAAAGELYLKNVSGTVQGNAISDVNTVLTLENLMPLAFDHQHISVGALNVGLPLTNGVVEASLDKKRRFSLHRAEWELAKGRLSSSPFSLSLDDMSADVTLTARQLDLPELFKIAPMEGLDATGTVNGTLPLHIQQGTVTLTDGVLEAEGGGFIRYNPQEPPAFLKNPANPSIADLGIALKAFEYETLKMTISGEAGKEQKIGLNIKGKNKDFYNGHPVALNLNVEGPLQNVLKYKPGGSQIPDNIRKNLEEYEKTHAKQ